MRFLAYSLLFLASSSALAQTKAPQLRGNVLVWQDAQLFTEPSESAHAFALSTFEAPRKDRVGYVMPMTVVSTKGDFVEVELVGDEDCTWSHVIVPDDIARVRLFVRRADIAPVLTKTFAKTFADGTSISLQPGTPMFATEAGTYLVSLHGDVVEVDAPVASVGESYAVPRSNGAVTAGQTLAIAHASKATLGERTVSLTAWKGAPVEKRGASSLVTIEDKCMTAHVMVPTAALSDVDESTIDVGGSSGGTATLSLRDECFLPRLTPLSVGTHQVAVASKPIYLHAEPMGKHACIQRQIRIESALEIKPTDEKLRICAPATKVARDKLRSARSAHGSTRR